MNKVTIIVPVYNASKYLKKTLDSILSQTYSNWEGILIDDGSVDISPKICDEYVMKDDRFKCIHVQNGGVSKARNLGVSIATGDYICFLDSDDQMRPIHLETCLKSISTADILVFSFKRWNCRNDEQIIREDHIIGKKDCHDYLYTLKETPSTSEFFCFPWNKMYRRSLLIDNKILFPVDISMREDEIFAYRYLPYVNEIITTSAILVDYNDEPSGLSAIKLSPNKSMPLARHLLNQTKCDNSDASKTILFFRAMTYMQDALINTPSNSGKNQIAQEMILNYKDKSFPFVKLDELNKLSRVMALALYTKSIAMLRCYAQLIRLYRWIKIAIIKDESLIRWGTNV